MSREALVWAAYTEVGTAEDNRDNRTKYGFWLANELRDPSQNGQPWCMTFFAWLYAKVGLYLGNAEYVKKLAWVPTALKIWIAEGRKTDSPQAGDAVIFNWDKKGEPEHIGMFIAWVVPYSLFITIEGNIGNRVWPQLRTMEFVEGFFDMLKKPTVL